MTNICEECPICLEPIENEKHSTTLKCNHKYHKLCLNMWLDRNPICPLCRIDVINVFKCKHYKYNFLNYKIKLEYDRLCINGYFKKKYIYYNNISKIGIVENVIFIFLKQTNKLIVKKYRLSNESLCKNLFTSIKNKFI